MQTGDRIEPCDPDAPIAGYVPGLWRPQPVVIPPARPDAAGERIPA